MAETRPARAYTISRGPLVSTSPVPDVGGDESPGSPLVVAVPRNPQELLVCWSVDWPNEFTAGHPTDQKIHVRLRGAGSSKSVPCEPLLGYVVVKELEPGEIYHVELGYFAAPEDWRVVSKGFEVMMPLSASPRGAAAEYATLPLHLTFQRAIEALGCPTEDQLMPVLARFQDRFEEKEELTTDELEMVTSLEMQPRELRESAQVGVALAAAPSIPVRPMLYGASSWTNGGG